MMNQVTLVGRLTEKPTLEERGSATIILAVPRTFKNIDGVYEEDFITCRLFGEVAKKIVNGVQMEV